MNHLIADNSVAALRDYLRQALQEHYDVREAENILTELFRHYAGWSRTEIALRAEHRFSESELLKYHFALKRLKQGEPLQYVLGVAHFCGFQLKVNKHVLIPRPETEELVQLIIQQNQKLSSKILDVGTGSGCIAIALKKNIPAADIHACDISLDALAYAKSNAIENDCLIHFYQLNILHEMVEQKFDIIVSNPPYVLRSDAATMHERVLKHEPHTALFVEDVDALLFYKRIIQLSKTHLTNDGFVICEMHEAMEAEMALLLKSEGVTNFQFHKDMQGRIRFIHFQL